MKSLARSKELNEKALTLMPGPHSNLSSLWQGSAPMFFTRAKEAHLWDADGNEYIDYMMGFGAGILGYGDTKFISRLKEQLDIFYFLAANVQSPLEIEVAEKFTKHVPCAEKLRFCLTGTECVQLAIRLARAYTKRRYFIRFEGHYHGWVDNLFGGLVDNNPSGKPFAVESAVDPFKTEGRDPDAFNQSFKIPWNNPEVLEEVLKKYGQEVALVHMEAIMCNAGCCLPRPGYLERVRELCTRYGVVLSFDEIITGFRLGLGGAQSFLGVKPDIATYGKAMAGGIPMSAIAGRKEILNLLYDQRVVGGGTFNGYPLGLAASLATIEILEDRTCAVYERIDNLQRQLMDGLREITKRRGISMLIQGVRGVFFSLFIDKQKAYDYRDLKGADEEKTKKFRSLLIDEGVLVFRGRWYMSAAHTQEDIERTLESADRALSRL